MISEERLGFIVIGAFIVGGVICVGLFGIIIAVAHHAL